MQINDENESTDVFGVMRPKQIGAMHGFFCGRAIACLAACPLGIGSRTLLPSRNAAWSVSNSRSNPVLSESKPIVEAVGESAYRIDAEEALKVGEIIREKPF